MLDGQVMSVLRDLAELDEEQLTLLFGLLDAGWREEWDCELLRVPLYAFGPEEAKIAHRTALRIGANFQGEHVTTFDLERLSSFAEDGLLRWRRHPEADLTIWNYTERCQYTRTWTPETLACRGLILDGEGNVVARPFRKFFNLGETGAPKPPNESYAVQTKIDGSLGITYTLDGELFVASRGSFDSEQAREATAMLRDSHLGFTHGTTPLFEIIYPENRIVVNYGDRRELVLLANIDNATGRDILLPSYSGAVVPHHGPLTVAEMRAWDVPNFEGFVLVYESGFRVKIKLEEYVRLHRVMTGLTPHRVWEALKAGADFDALLTGVPDETFEEIDGIRRDIVERRDKLIRDAHRVYENAPLDASRKELAANFFASEANPNLCFSLLDGRDISDQAWRLVEPKKTTIDTEDPTCNSEAA